MAKKENEVAVRDEKAVAPPQKSVASMKSEWDAPELSSRDVVIPSILLMQPMSPQVTDAQAAFGELRESLNMEKLGDFKLGFEFIPFKLHKLFIERVDKGDEKEFLRAVDITPENENLPYEDHEVIDGKEEKIIRDRVMKYFVLLVSELELGTAIPYTISFKRSSFKAGQKLATQMFMKNINSGKTPASMIMTLSASKKTEDNKTWGILDVAPSKPTPDKFIADAFKWLETVRSGKAREHMIDDESVGSTREIVVDGDKVDTKTGEIKEDIPF